MRPGARQGGLRRFRPREGPKAGRSFTLRDLDRLAREVALARDGGRCRRCGTERGLQWCHVYTRGIRSMRWDLDNSFIACMGCHRWWHDRPVDAAAWWRAQVGNEKADALMLKAGRPKGRVDLVMTGIALEQELRRALEGS